MDLKTKGKFVLTIWPEHCLLGTRGHTVVPIISDALNEWSRCRQKHVEYVMKGQNPLTEMYSALMAEVPIPDDPTTQLNFNLLRRLENSGQLVVCGQALSHCVNFTVRDLVHLWRTEKSRIFLLRDCTSPVANFESQGEQFVDEMEKKGVQIISSEDLFLLQKSPRVNKENVC
mmetsp:Transcript_17406/g.29168  ORF Transcript_17406/g.29168 Transcript_17406/m.29168 type:complete len:173 (+) Transcript_17406:738-1256(+)